MCRAITLDRPELAQQVIEVKPTTLKQANAYVEAVHRHHGRVVGHKWSLAAFKDGRLCGVAIVGRPTGRRLDDGNTLEVTRPLHRWNEKRLLGTIRRLRPSGEARGLR